MNVYVVRHTSQSCEVVSKVDQDLSNVIAHPTNDNLVVVSTLHKVLFVDATTLQTVGMIESFDIREIIEGEYICDVTMCGDGMKCVVTTRSACVVYDIADIESIVKITRREMKVGWSSDIHSDGSKVVWGGKEGVKLYDITTSQPTTTLCEGDTWFVRFVYQPEGVLYQDGDNRVHLMDMSGVVLREFSGQHNSRSPTIINNNKWLVTGNSDKSIHIHDFTTGETIYRFYHPSSEGFRSFVSQSDQNKLIGLDYNGTIIVMATNAAH